MPISIQDTTPLVALVIAMAVSMLVIPVVWRFAATLGMIDQPGKRKVHDVAIPRVGGLGILAGSLIAVFSLLDLSQVAIAYIIGSLIILLFGVWDDTRQVGPYTKFFGQFLAAGVAIFYGDVWIRHLPFTDIDGVSAWVGIPFTFFAVIGMANAVNTSDGLDGLAGGEALLSLIVIAFLAYIAGGIEACVIATACIGGILGFLRYNTHPAEIFMGDTGSQFLGYTLGFLAVLVTQKVHPALSPALTLLFLGLPVIDLMAVMTVRLKNGHSPFHADKTHIHHRILKLGFDHYETVVVIYSLQALLVISAIFLRYQSDLLIIVLYTTTVVILFGSLTYAEKNNWRNISQTHESLSNSVMYVRKHKSRILKTSTSIVKYAIPVYLISASLMADVIPRDFGIIATVFFFIMLIDSFLSKDKQGVSIRGGVYITAIFSVYLMQYTEATKSQALIDGVFFGLLAASIAIVVRYATDKKFQTSPMDYLIVFGVLAIAVFGGRYLQIKDIGLLIVKGMVILYGAELLFIHMAKRWNILNISALLTLLIFGYRGLFS